MSFLTSLPLRPLARLVVIAGLSGCQLACASSTAKREQAHASANERKDLNHHALARFNLRGYSPSRSKEVVVMAHEDLAGHAWQVQDSTGALVLQGVFGPARSGPTNYTPWRYHDILDVSALRTLGEYTLHSPHLASAKLVIKATPYADLAQTVLRHLHVERSGTNDALLHSASHMLDRQAWVYRPKGGDFSTGLWERDPAGTKVDGQGGWYDAGDYIKFTLTTAYTTYYLLRAWEVAPELFPRQLSTSDLPDVLDEAVFGLEYLSKTMPNRDTFIVQVGTGEDHEQGLRLPQNDRLDGQRKALCAISAPHMGSTAAALALGSAVLSKRGKPELAARYLQAAKTIYERAIEPMVLPEGAFENNATNEFYRDRSSVDNLGLAALELHLATGDPLYLTQAEAYIARAGVPKNASWNELALDLMARAAKISAQAKSNLAQALHDFAAFDRERGNLWGIPMVQEWGPLPNALIVASYAGLTQLEGLAQPANSGETPAQRGYAALTYDNLDYLLGRNNWGICMVALPDTPGCITKIYNTIYKLTKSAPVGALAEGPGSRAVYQGIKQWIDPSPRDHELEIYNTPTTYFSDNAGNFQTMETVTYGQAVAAFFFAVLHRLETVSTP